jgi:hypothetical protein
LSWVRSSYLIGNDLVLYRTFMLAGRTVDPSTIPVTWPPRVASWPLGPSCDPPYIRNRKSAQGFFCACNQSLSLRSPGHVRVRNILLRRTRSLFLYIFLIYSLIHLFVGIFIRSTHPTVYRSIWFILCYNIYRISFSIDPFDFRNLFLLVGLLEAYYINHKTLFLGSP